MARPIVLFGATGYTGRLVADALVARDARPLLAARNETAVTKMAADLGGLDSAVADVSRPETLRELMQKDIVLVSTVGPFMRWGATAVEAAVDAGGIYLDSTGEPPFIRDVFERRDRPAHASGAALVAAFGYDFAPGNLAGALALERAGERAVKVSVGDFLTGGGSFREMMSGGTAASVAGVMLAPHFAFRNAQVVTERSAKRVRSFEVRGGKRLSGISIGSSEHFALPRLHPSLRQVDAYLGWFGPGARAMQAVSVLGGVPGVRSAADKVSGRFLRGSTGGPGPEARGKFGSLIVAEAEDAAGSVLQHVELHGPNPYTFTGEILAWGAMHAAEHGLKGTGALGPVEAYGLRELEAACTEIGLKEVESTVKVGW